MLVVADSGSTKTNWLSEKGTLHETIGLNPFFHTVDSVVGELRKHTALLEEAANVSQLYFYGAGCSNAARNSIIHAGLQHIFPKANIYVDHDLMAAAYATYDGRTGISCILGTGSNSCVFDGKKIDNSVPALGYILGDEGSGSYFGKQLLSAFLYGELPDATHKILANQYQLTKEKIFSAVYNEPHANVYLASFSKVLSETPDREYVNNMVREGFKKFFKHHVACFRDYKKMPVHFVGSLAFHFKYLLQAVANEYSCELGKIDKQPVHALMQWHKAQSLPA